MLTRHIEELQKDLLTLAVHEGALNAMADAVLNAGTNNSEGTKTPYIQFGGGPRRGDVATHEPHLLAR